MSEKEEENDIPIEIKSDESESTPEINEEIIEDTESNETQDLVEETIEEENQDLRTLAGIVSGVGFLLVLISFGARRKRKEGGAKKIEKKPTT